MIVKILFEYNVVGDDKYTYIESFETDINEHIAKSMQTSCVRNRLRKSLLNRGIIIENIKDKKQGKHLAFCSFKEYNLWQGWCIMEEKRKYKNEKDL